MKKIYLLLAIGLCHLLYSQNTLFHDTQGETSVNGGQIQHNLQIALPPGIANVSPNISLVYTSGSGNGIAGFGWSISGITSISRVGKTIERDGEVVSPKLDYTDNFQYNGQKLLLKPGTGTYGGNGAEYLTENYSNIKIKSVGSFSNGDVMTWFVTGPEHFEVTYEDGSQAWYGKYVTAAANNATTPLEYNIVKWRDAQGNIINYNYEQENNVAVIKSITWGGNETINKPNVNEIIFNYAGRDLNEISYVSGALFIQNKILQEIVVKTNGLQFKKYIIDNIKNINNSKYQIVNKITEFNSQNEPANPVEFNYPISTSPNPETINIPNDNPFSGVKLTGDFNGDSYIDFIMSNGTVKLGAFNDTFSTISTNKYFNSDALTVNTLLDENGKVYNGNGIVQYESGKIVGYIFRDNSFVKVFEKFVYDSSDCTLTAGGGSLGCRIDATLNEGDIDGDGISNIFLSIARIERVCVPDNIIPSGKGEVPPCNTEDIVTDVGDFVIDLKNQNLPISTYTTETSTYTGSFQSKYLDVDSDGKIDVINMTSSSCTIFEFIKTAPNIYLKKIKSLSYLVENKDPQFPVLYGDFNGDGKVDFVIPITENKSSGKDDWRFYMGTGRGFKSFVKSDFMWYHKPYTTWNNGYALIFRIHNYSISDINHDGKSDIIHVISKSSADIYTGSRRYYSYNIESRQPNGAENNGSINFMSPPLKTFQNTVDDIYDLTQFTPITVPIKSGNNQYDLYLYWKNTVVRYKSETGVTELARIKSLKRGDLLTEIEYKELDPLINPNIYAASNSEIYPFKEMERIPQSYVVSQLKQGGKKQDFRYRGYITHFLGRGVVGFRQIAQSSWYANGYESTKIWNGVEIDPKKLGVAVKEWSIRTNSENNIIPTDISENNSQLLSFNKINYPNINVIANGVKLLLPESSLKKDFLKNITTTSTISYGEYYLPVLTEINIANGFARKTTEMHYVNNPNGVGKDYYIGRLDWKEEINYAYGDSKKLKESYIYNNNLIESLTKYDNTNIGWIKEKYTYDEGDLTGFGNITKKEITNSIDAQIIITKSQYGQTGRFVEKTTDNLGLETLITYNDWGQVKTQTDPLNNTVSNIYDNWGKLQSSISNLGGMTSYQYEKFNESGISGTKITQISPGGNIKVSFINSLGQNYKNVTKAFEQNKYVVSETIYDLIGRKWFESEPYFTNSISSNSSSANSSTWTEIQYNDNFYPPKVTVKAFNNGKEMVTSTSGRTTTITESNGYARTYTKTTDTIGNLISSTDPGGTITYTYNAAGQQIKAQYAENSVTTSYDAWGRKSEFNDPANGKYEYQYTGFGEIKKETSRKGYKEYFYKTNGLLDQIKEKSNDGTSTDKNYLFTYNPFGQLTQKSGTTNGKSFTTAYAYRPEGRLGWTTEYLEGRQFYKQNIVYDQFGRIKRYDQGLVSNGVTTAVAVENNYSTWDGTLYQLKQENTGKILWELQTTNAKGQVKDAKLGASQIQNDYDPFGFLNTSTHVSTAANLLDTSYIFDAVRNELKQRKHNNFGITELFDYDTNNRLINWTDPVTGIKPVNDRNTYDIKGRITVNDQLGNIGYTIGGNIYRASKINLNANGLANYGIGGQNILLQNITYNENNDPIKIRGTQHDYAFEYGLTESRQIMSYGGKFTDSQNAQFTKYYSESGDAEVILNRATGQEKHLLYIGGSPYESNIVYLKDFAESTLKFVFLHKDYLGNILAISDEAGNALEKRHFDAWGNFTHLQKGTAAVITNVQQIAATNLLIDRGYTSHEHLAGVALIHMNGRLYDPLLRRFLNADENIQDNTNTQNYNKYGYVMNNPLIYSDPSGEFIWIAMAIGAVIGGVQNGLSSMKNGGSFWGGFWKGAIVGAGSAFFALGMPIGILPGFMFGATTGAFFGALSAALNGQNVSSAGLMGGLIGGVVGAVSGGYKAYKAGINVWTGTGTSVRAMDMPRIDGVSTNDPYALSTDQEMRNLYNEKIGSVDGISLEQVEEKINTNVSLATNNNLPKGFSIERNSDLILKPDGGTAGAVTITDWRNGRIIRTGQSYIFIAPGIKRLNLYGQNMVFKHEFLHAWHWMNYPSSGSLDSFNSGIYNTFSERATSTFSLAYEKAYNLNYMLSTTRAALKEAGGMLYPKFMSWRNFNNIIPLWIK